ncbi:TonB-dependent receptor [Paenalcaligenes suwonensis]|uniref:TonB-dependent receptor n=1 Tax=Paenalcaligenes suwonensis TaxID=1202713 RepID=UPI001F6144B9|nr:TonB-dependent siderophore receptor [Paenalcaligenes suwonensis]
MQIPIHQIGVAAMLATCPFAASHAAVPENSQSSDESVQTSTLAPIQVRGLQTRIVNGPIDFTSTTTTASRLGLQINETPASVTVINRETIEQRAAENTQEMLRGVPGMSASSPPGAVNVSYRGFTSGQVAVLYNGINLQETGQATRPVDSWIYERVEAMGGPSGFLSGAGAVGGSINYISKLAQRDEFYDVQLRVGSDDLRSAAIGLNRQLMGQEGGTAHYVRIDASHRSGDGWVDRNSSRATQVAVSVLSDLTAQLSHTLAYEYQHEIERSPYFGTPVLNPKEGELKIDSKTRTKNYNSRDARYEQRVQWLRSMLDYSLSDAWQFRNTAYWYEARRDFRNVENYNYTADNSAVMRSGPYLQRHEHQLYGNRLETIYNGTIVCLKSDWAFALDGSISYRTNFPSSATYLSVVDPYDFEVEDFFDIPGMYDSFQKDRRTRLRTLAISAENRTELLSNVQLITALRYERLKLDLNNYRSSSPTNPAHFGRSYSATTGRVGLVWDPASGVNLYAQYATSADAPAGSLTTTSYANLNDNAKLSTGNQVEVGGRFSFWDDRITVGLAAYEIKRKNVATPDPQNPRTTIQAGKQSSRGVEFTLGMQPTAALRLQANLAFVDAQYDNFRQKIGNDAVSMAGNRPVNVPNRVANLWVDYDFHPQWTASAAVRHVSKVYGNVANTYYVPAYTLLDLGVSYKLSSNLSVAARVRNVTNEKYAVGTNSISYYYAGAPRTYELTLRAAF